MGYKVVVVESFKSDRCVGSPPFCANELVIALDLRGFESLGELAVRFSPRAARGIVVLLLAAGAQNSAG